MAISSPSFNPSATQTATTGSYVSSTLIAQLNLQKHDVSEELIKKYGDQGLSGYLDSIGKVTAVGSDEFLHFEENLLHQEYALKTGATCVVFVGDNTTDATFEMQSTDDGQQIRAGANILFDNGDLAHVASITDDDTFVAEPFGTWSSTTESYWRARKFIVVGLEFGKGTNQPGSLEPSVSKVTGRTAIYKESYAVSGSDATQIAYVKVSSPETGKSGYVWYIKGEGDTRKRFNDYLEASMMFSEKDTNVDAAGITGQQGLIDNVNSNGMRDLSGTMLTDARVDAWVDAIDKQRGPAEYTAWCGLDVSLALDDWMASKNQTTAVGEQNWGAFNNSKDMALNFGFQSFTRGGYTFHKKTYDLFNQLGMGGSVGYRKKALFIPSGVQKDPRSGLNIPALQIRYREANGYSRKMEHWFTGSAILAQPNSTEDVLRCHYRTERGVQVFGVNRYLLASVA
jgi:hypothetical protein